MREVLFRGQRTDNKGFIYGSLEIDHKNRCFISYWAKLEIKGFVENAKYTHEVISETVGQFTGLKGKNNNEIYEGDILKTEYGICYVIWFDAAFALKSPGSEAIDFEHSSVYELSEVIGNIHENPELLK